jgi:hypothetical protein
MDGVSFKWVWLLVAIIAIAGLAHASPKWGKWIFAIAIISALAVASERIAGAAGAKIGS